jgi:hypothetical protein
VGGRGGGGGGGGGGGRIGYVSIIFAPDCRCGVGFRSSCLDQNLAHLMYKLTNSAKCSTDSISEMVNSHLIILQAKIVYCKSINFTGIN